MKNTDGSGGTRFSEGKGPMVGAPLFGLYPGLLWLRFCYWALSPRDEENQKLLIDALMWTGIEYPAQVIGLVSAKGAEKYSLMDWVQGQRLSTLVNSCGRHIEKHILAGSDIKTALEPESGFPHVHHALWNLLCWTSLEELGQGDRLDDYTHLKGINTVKADLADCCGLGCLECPLKESA